MWEKHAVFVVMADNGESYEDYREYRLGIFYKKEDAELYLSNAGWQKEDKSHRLRWHKSIEDYGWTYDCTAWLEEDSVSF